MRRVGKRADGYILAIDREADGHGTVIRVAKGRIIAIKVARADAKLCPNPQASRRNLN